MSYAVGVTLIVPGRAVVTDQPDNFLAIGPGMLCRRPGLDPFVLWRNFMPCRTTMLPKCDRGQCAIRQTGIEQRGIGRPMLEEPGLIFDDLVGNAMIVHPLTEDRDKPAGVRLLGHCRQQGHVRDFAPTDKFDDHRGRVGACPPCRDDGRTLARAHAAIASQRSGHTGGLVVTR